MSLAADILTALPSAAIIAMLSVGYSVAYSSMNLVNFAHGEVFMAGALSGYLVSERVGPALQGSNSGMWTTIGTAIVIGGCTGIILAVLLERWVYRPFLGGPRVMLVMMALGASLTLQQVGQLVLRASGTGSSERRYSIQGLDAPVVVGLTRPDILAIGLLFLGIIIVAHLTYRTNFGVGMRAVAYSIPALRRLKVPVEGVLTRSFALGGGLAGVAGAIYGARHTVAPFMGFEPGMLAFLACVVGGRSVLGAVVGAITIGILDGVLSSHLGASFRSLMVHASLVLVLVIRPDGALSPGAARSI